MTRRLQSTAAVTALTLRQLPVFDSSIKISDYKFWPMEKEASSFNWNRKRMANNK